MVPISGLSPHMAPVKDFFKVFCTKVVTYMGAFKGKTMTAATELTTMQPRLEILITKLNRPYNSNVESRNRQAAALLANPSQSEMYTESNILLFESACENFSMQIAIPSGTPPTQTTRPNLRDRKAAASFQQKIFI